MHDVLKQIESTVLSFSKLNGLYIFPHLFINYVMFGLYLHWGPHYLAMAVEPGSLNDGRLCPNGYPLPSILVWLDLIADELAELVNYATKAEGILLANGYTLLYHRKQTDLTVL